MKGIKAVWIFFWAALSIPFAMAVVFCAFMAGGRKMAAIMARDLGFW